jgi:hypothetical protein
MEDINRLYKIITGQLYRVGTVAREDGQNNSREPVSDPYMELTRLKIRKAEALPIYLAVMDDYDCIVESIDQLLNCMREMEGATVRPYSDSQA